MIERVVSRYPRKEMNSTELYVSYHFQDPSTAIEMKLVVRNKDGFRCVHCPINKPSASKVQMRIRISLECRLFHRTLISNGVLMSNFEVVATSGHVNFLTQN